MGQVCFVPHHLTSVTHHVTNVIHQVTNATHHIINVTLQESERTVHKTNLMNPLWFVKRIRLQGRALMSFIIGCADRVRAVWQGRTRHPRGQPRPTCTRGGAPRTREILVRTIRSLRPETITNIKMKDGKWWMIFFPIWYSRHVVLCWATKIIYNSLLRFLNLFQPDL